MGCAGLAQRVRLRVSEPPCSHTHPPSSPSFGAVKGAILFPIIFLWQVFGVLGVNLAMIITIIDHSYAALRL